MGPFLAVLLAYPLLIGLWQGWLVPEMPERPRRVGSRVELPIWVGAGHGPFTTEGPVETADVLFLGDSRVTNGLYLDRFEEAGLGDCALVWAGGAKIQSLLAAAEHLKPGRLVLTLSALEFSYINQDIQEIIVAVPWPDFEKGDARAQLESWRESRAQALGEAGHRPQDFESILSRIEDLIWTSWEEHAATTSGLDVRWSRAVSDARMRAVHTVATGSWDRSWFQPLDPHQSDNAYRGKLKIPPKKDHGKALERAARGIKKLRKQGIDVVCVRFPMSPSLLAIEETFITREQFAEICESAGVPYLDHSQDTYSTRDGAHLTAPSPEAFSRALAGELVDLGW